MQQLNPSEISDLIKDRIESLDIASQPRNEGSIVSVSDGIIRVHGLAAARYGEMIEFRAASTAWRSTSSATPSAWSSATTRTSPKA